MRQKSIDMFLNHTKNCDLSRCITADFGGQESVVLVGKNGKESVINPLNKLFKIYHTFNIDHKPDFPTDLTKPLTDFENKYDLVISFDTLEHVTCPHTFCQNMVHVSKSGGRIYLSTVFAWPYHSSKDYFRFSPDALELCFRDSPIKIIACGWEEDSTYIRKQTGVFLYAQKK